jgi:Cu/Ag efflux pump CusA
MMPVLLARGDPSHRRRERLPSSGRNSQPTGLERCRIHLGAAQQVGPALFYSLIIVVSFLLVFLLEEQEGRVVPPTGVDQQ